MDLTLARDLVCARMAQLGLLDDSLVPCLVFAIQINPDLAARLARAINLCNTRAFAHEREALAQTFVGLEVSHDDY